VQENGNIRNELQEYKKMAVRKMTALGKMMKKCSPKSGPTNWEKLGYKSHQMCVKGEFRKSKR